MITVKSNTSKIEKLQSFITISLISLISLITQKLYGLFHKNYFQNYSLILTFWGQVNTENMVAEMVQNSVSFTLCVQSCLIHIQSCFYLYSVNIYIFSLI